MSGSTVEFETRSSEVSQPGLTSFRNFLLNHASELDESNVSRLETNVLIICGQTGRGKTSLVKSLLHNHFNWEIGTHFSNSCVEHKDDQVAILDSSGFGRGSFSHLRGSGVFPTRFRKRTICTSRESGCGKSSLMNFLKERHRYWSEEMSSILRVEQKLISGVYSGDRGNNSNQVIKMEHSALQGRNSQWNLEVKYRLRGNKAPSNRWVNIWNLYPDAKVELKHNEIELTISSPNEDHEFAVFGTPEIGDKKRMQMAIFGGKPTQGKHWHIFVTLFDDTMMAFKRVCEREESKGRQLLTTLAGLFVSNSDEDIKIDITAFEDGWKVIGSNLMTIKSKDAWNSPENSTDFPYCVFEIAHIDETKQTFFCGIQASHLNDTAETELVAIFEQKQENEVYLTSRNFILPPELTIKEDNFFGALRTCSWTTHRREGPRREPLFGTCLLLPEELFADVLMCERRTIVYDNLAEEIINCLNSPASTFWRIRLVEENEGQYDMLLHWKLEQTEAFISLLMLVFFVGCLTGTRFDPPHPLKTDETDGNVLLSWKEQRLTDAF